MASEPTSTPIEPTTLTPLPPPILLTPRLHLRPMIPDDAPLMALHASPASITAYMSLAFSYPYTLQHASEWIALNLHNNLSNYVIAERSSPDKFIGAIGLKQGSDVETGTAEVGYWIGDEFKGRGYVSEALRGIRDWAFGLPGANSDSTSTSEGGGEFKYRRLHAGVFSENLASMRILEKCGFEKEGVLKEHVRTRYGVVMDLHVFGMTRGRWEEVKRREEGARTV
ncbi:acyl-CoA N-acyltransferase [Amniculicola lignicola CBS 123094]|uniref:Acyl-CoA N-acyltransferase n=1 Tax=Amniculicola lignicola CBS 123094 TaxID=1392246 RepID=A0A6A5X573_9PLEO|nr:acyl-CoA N-acyltransferase [Amniculicola lignicola CBS 123094]